MISRTALVSIALILFVSVIFVVDQNYDQTQSKKNPKSITGNTKNANCPEVVNGDFDCNGIIDLLDFDMWQNQFVKMGEKVSADSNGDGKVSLVDYETWRASFASE